MKRLPERDSTRDLPDEDLDVVDDALAATRFEGAALFRSEMVAPWSIVSWPQEDLRAYFVNGEPNARVVMFHAVVEGEVEYVDHAGQAVLAEPGDIVLFAGGHQHESRQGTPDGPLPSRGVTPARWGTVRFGDGPPTAVTMCGVLVIRETQLNPLLEALPDMVVLRRDSRSAATYNILLSVLTGPGPGRRALLDRAAEMLFVLAVRDVAAWKERPPWFRAVNDPGVGRAIRSMHSRPAAKWSVQELAAASGLSRSGLAARFHSTLGVTPGRYLTRWRMNLATRLLSNPSLSVSAVAEKVGYANEFAFSRAFKRHLGVAPSLWRKQ